MSGCATCQGKRSGYTLLELVVALMAAGALLVGLSSTIFIATQATDTSATATAAIIEGNGALTDLLANLEFAQSFSERTATVLTFTVADRDGDAVNETFRYAWSGVPGHPLTRQHNGGTVVTIADGVHVFAHDLPTPSANLLSNGDMEGGPTGWQAFPNSTMQSVDYAAYSGTRSLYDYRWTASDESGVGQNVASLITSGATYEIGGWLKKWAVAEPFGARVQLRVTSSNEGEQTFAGNAFDINNSSWTHVYGTVTPVWNGTLLSAYWEARGVANIQEIYLDEAYMRAAAGARQIVNIRLQVGGDSRSLIQSGVRLLNSPL